MADDSGPDSRAMTTPDDRRRLAALHELAAMEQARERALAGDCEVSRETLDLFCAFVY